MARVRRWEPWGYVRVAAEMRALAARLEEPVWGSTDGSVPVAPEADEPVPPEIAEVLVEGLVGEQAVAADHPANGDRGRIAALERLLGRCRLAQIEERDGWERRLADVVEANARNLEVARAAQAGQARAEARLAELEAAVARPKVDEDMQRVCDALGVPEAESLHDLVEAAKGLSFWQVVRVEGRDELDIRGRRYVPLAAVDAVLAAVRKAFSS